MEGLRWRWRGENWWRVKRAWRGKRGGKMREKGGRKGARKHTREALIVVPLWLRCSLVTFNFVRTEFKWEIVETHWHESHGIASTASFKRESLVWGFTTKWSQHPSLWLGSRAMRTSNEDLAALSRWSLASSSVNICSASLLNQLCGWQEPPVLVLFYRKIHQIGTHLKGGYFSCRQIVFFCFFVFFSPWFFIPPSISWCIDTQNGPPKGRTGMHNSTAYML